MSRVASLRPNVLLSLLRSQACMSTDATSVAEKVLKAANLQAGSILLLLCILVCVFSVIDAELIIWVPKGF